jgi:hypothetical protein
MNTGVSEEPAAAALPPSALKMKATFFFESPDILVQPTLEPAI